MATAFIFDETMFNKQRFVLNFVLKVYTFYIKSVKNSPIGIYKHIRNA